MDATRTPTARAREAEGIGWLAARNVARRVSAGGISRSAERAPQRNQRIQGTQKRADCIMCEGRRTRESLRRAGPRDGVGCRAVQGEGLGRRRANG